MLIRRLVRTLAHTPGALAHGASALTVVAMVELMLRRKGALSRASLGVEGALKELNEARVQERDRATRKIARCWRQHLLRHPSTRPGKYKRLYIEEAARGSGGRRGVRWFSRAALLARDLRRESDPVQAATAEAWRACVLESANGDGEQVMRHQDYLRMTTLLYILAEQLRLASSSRSKKVEVNYADCLQCAVRDCKRDMEGKGFLERSDFMGVWVEVRVGAARARGAATGPATHSDRRARAGGRGRGGGWWG